MVKNRNVIVNKIGERRYNNELALLEAMEGDDEDVFKNYPLDRRDESLMDKELAKGFYEHVGIEGCRLSVDQK